MLVRILNWLMIMAEREGVGQKRLQLTTKKSMSLGLMPGSRHTVKQLVPLQLGCLAKAGEFAAALHQAEQWKG